MEKEITCVAALLILKRYRIPNVVSHIVRNIVPYICREADR